MKRIAIGLKALVCAGLFMAAGTANASTVISNGYSFFEEINPNGADQLTGWLGKGSLTMTRIFDSSEFYAQSELDTGYGRFPQNDELDAAVAGKGPTFTVMGVSIGTRLAFIGWYNPINGLTATGGSTDETEMDAFIFNLTTDLVFRRNLEIPPVPDVPKVSNIGAGRDIVLRNPAMRGGIIEGTTSRTNYVYPVGQNLLWDPLYSDSNAPRFNVFSLEVFSISVDALATPSAVPEPATWGMMIVGFGMVGGAARYKRRKTTTTYA